MTDSDPGIAAPASEPAAAATPPRSRSRLPWFALILLMLIGGVGYVLWWQQQGLRDARRSDAEWRQVVDALRAELASLDREVDAGRERQRQIEARIGETVAGVRVVRDEVLGIAERAVRLEEAVGALSQRREGGQLALRLDEVEFLLQFGQQRAELFADRAAAVRAFELAEAALRQIEDASYAGLRGSLSQERDSLQQASDDPRPLLRRPLAALIEQLPQWPLRATQAAESTESTLQQLLQRLVTVRRVSDSQMALSPLERASRRAGLQLALGLALAALETADAEAWKQHLRRAAADIDELFVADAAMVREGQALVQRALATDIAPRPPRLGTTLRELRAMRATRAAAGRAVSDMEPAVERP